MNEIGKKTREAVNQQTLATLSPQELLAPGLRALESALQAPQPSSQLRHEIKDDRLDLEASGKSVEFTPSATSTQKSIKFVALFK